MNKANNSSIDRLKQKRNIGIAKMRDFYQMKPDAPIFQMEFGLPILDRWKREGHINDSTDFYDLFGYDEPGTHSLGQLGWCEAPFSPSFDVEILEDKGDYELVRDIAGRHVLYFKGRRNGFMPEYLEHPVKDMKTWEENCKWRLDPSDSRRYSDLNERMKVAVECAESGMFIVQHIIGGYMYLRSLIGPVELLYMFYDDPKLIHECMRTWFELADEVTKRHQQYVTFDEIFLAEDICYNHGPLIAPNMIREFLFPYYQQLISNVKKRQKDKSRKLHIQIDTDGNAVPVIDLYKEIGMDYMSPFEVASGCDVVQIAKDYPELLIRGGIDKRILASSKEAIDREVDRIMPFMKKRGGYIPCCDHGVPEETSFENYMHYRKRMLEF
ncbi:MAG TPA: hypothetical protein GX505_09515 [Clostridiales bacterium]|nr:hypothetical protein [Clostridiales bacterium]